MKHLFFLLFFSAFTFANVLAQTDSSSIKKPAHSFSHRDSVYMAKISSNGNLMLAGGIGLCGVGGYLIYQGNKVYTNDPPQSATYNSDKERNHKQGIIYYAAGGVAIAAGIIVVALGTKNKIEFRQRKKLMELQSGILDNGNLGLALNF